MAEQITQDKMAVSLFTDNPTYYTEPRRQSCNQFFPA